jgi:hypothetical protein
MTAERLMMNLQAHHAAADSAGLTATAGFEIQPMDSR